MCYLKTSWWKFIRFIFVDFWYFITGKTRREIQKQEMTLREKELREVEDIKREILLISREVFIPEDVQTVLDFAIECQSSISYSLFKNLREYAGQEDLLSQEKSQLSLQLNDFRALKVKVIFIGYWGKKSAFRFFNELVATGDWNLFFNQREDYGYEDGAAICDYWVEHIATGWKAVMHHESLWYVDQFKQKPSPCDEIIKRYGY